MVTELITKNIINAFTGTTPVKAIYRGTNKIWEKGSGPVPPEPTEWGGLTFTAVEPGVTVGIVNNGTNNPDLHYSLDGANWSNLSSGNTVTLSSTGQKLYLKGNNTNGFSTSQNDCSSFSVTGGKIDVSGNIMSLNYGDDYEAYSEVKEYNFCFLFSKCSTIVSADKLVLPTTVGRYCYYYMFSTCSSLTKAPELPATTLAQSCYHGMFNKCSSLTKAPELPAMKTDSYSYRQMFEQCTSLTDVELPATTLGVSCYYQMFSGCNSLKHIKIGYKGNSITSYTSNWFPNNVETVELTSTEGTKWAYTVVQSPTGIMGNAKVIVNGVNIRDIENSLVITALEDTTINFNHYGTNQTTTKPEMLYATDSSLVYKDFDYNNGLSLTEGQTVYIACSTNKFSQSTANYSVFTSTGNISVSGNVLSLVNQYGVGSYSFYKLFYNCTTLNTVSNILHSTTLGSNCYNSMFYGCSSLTEAPELPATTLTQSCYYMMFRGTNITKAPELPATELQTSCYNSMFYGCSSLTEAPELPATTVAQSCYNAMFYGCSSLTEAPELPATTLTQSCYNQMFYNCTSLTKAPELPATTLAQSCYNNMFYGCSSLTEAPTKLPATTLQSSCYASMFKGSGITKAPELPATTLGQSCYRYMFQNCTSLTEAPELPATTLQSTCYDSMFSGCTSLTKAPTELPATTLVSNCYASMFSGCSSLTSSPILRAEKLISGCYGKMFQNCTNLSVVKTYQTVAPSTSYSSTWMSGVSSTGTFFTKQIGSEWRTTVARGTSTVPSGWEMIPNLV